MKTVAFLLYLFAAVIFLGNALVSDESISPYWGFTVASLASAVFMLDAHK